MIKIDFTIERDGHKFEDSITLEDNHTFSEIEIEEMKETRFQNFLILQPKEKINEGEI